MSGDVFVVKPRKAPVIGLADDDDPLASVESLPPSDEYARSEFESRLPRPQQAPAAIVSRSPEFWGGVASVDATPTSDVAIAEFGARSPAASRIVGALNTQRARVEAEANDDFNRDRAETRSPSMRAARGAAIELQDSPLFSTLSHGLDTATFGLADEIVGAGVSGMSRAGLLDEPEIEYRDIQRALEEATAESGRRHPTDALIGTGLGLAATAPLFEAAVPRAAAEVPLTLGNVARRAAPVVGTSTAIGGAGGYLGAPEGRELEGTLQGLGTGFTVGALGATPVSVARGMARGPMRNLGAAVLEGTGGGVLAGPGMSRRTMDEPMGLAEDVGESAFGGGVFGVGLGGLGSTLSAANRGRAAIARAFPGQVPDIAPIRVPNQLDEGFLSAGRISDDAEFAPMGLDDELQAPPPPDALDTAERMRAERAERPLVLRLFGDSLRGDPATLRLNSLGITGRRDLRAADNAFGSREAALAALNDIGLGMPNSVEGVREARDIAHRIGMQERSALADIHRRVAESGEVIPGLSLGRRVSGHAADLSTGIQGRDVRAVQAALEERANEFRYGQGGVRQTPRRYMEDVEVLPPEGATLMRDPETGRMMRAAPVIERMPVTSIPEPFTIPYETLRDEMEQQAYRNRGTYSGSRVGAPSPMEEAGIDIYRAEAAERDAAIQRALGPQGYADYMRRNRASRAAGLVTGVDYNARQPADLRGAIGATADIAAGNPIGPITGRMRERLIGDYQHSILATLNEIGGANPQQVMQGAANLVQRTGGAIDPATSALVSEMSRTGRGDPAVFLRIAQTATDADVALNARRAYALANNAQNWPPILRYIQRVAQTDPEQSIRLANAAEAASQAGTLPALLAVMQNTREFETLDALAGESLRDAPVEFDQSDLDEERMDMGLDPLSPQSGGDAGSDDMDIDDINEERRDMGLPPIERSH